MTKDTTKEAAVATEVLLFDHWFDAIEDGVRACARGLIETMPEEELSGALSCPRYGRRKPGEDEAALRGSALSGRPANPPLGQLRLGSNMINAGAAARRAWKPPLAASARIVLSRVRSGAALRSRAFSASRSYIFLT